MGWEVEDVLKGLSILSSATTSLVDSTYKKEVAIMQTNAALDMQNLKNKADVTNNNNKTALSDLNHQLSFQEKVMPKLVNELKDHNINYKSLLNIDEMNQTLEGNKLWESLGEEKRNNMLHWGESTTNILTSIGNKQEAIAINTAKKHQLESMISSALDGADMAANESKDLNEDGLISLAEYKQEYDNNYTMQGMMSSLDNIVQDDGKTIFDKSMTEGAIGEHLSSRDMKAQAAGFKSAFPSQKEDLQAQQALINLQKSQAVGPDREILAYADELRDSGAYDQASAQYKRIGINLTSDEVENHYWASKGKATGGGKLSGSTTIIDNFKANTGQILDEASATILATAPAFVKSRVYDLSELKESGANIAPGDVDGAISYTSKPLANLFGWLSEPGSDKYLYQHVSSDSEYGKGKDAKGKIKEGWQLDRFDTYEDRRDYMHDFIKQNLSVEHGGEVAGDDKLFGQTGFSKEFVESVDWSGWIFNKGSDANKTKMLNEMMDNIKLFKEGDSLVRDFQAGQNLGEDGEFNSNQFMDDAGFKNVNEEQNLLAEDQFQNVFADKSNQFRYDPTYGNIFTASDNKMPAINSSLDLISKDSTLNDIFKNNSFVKNEKFLIDNEDSIGFFTELKNSESNNDFYKTLDVTNVDSAKVADWNNYVEINAGNLLKQNVNLEWDGSSEQEDILLGSNIMHASINANQSSKRKELMTVLDSLSKEGKINVFSDDDYEYSDGSYVLKDNTRVHVDKPTTGNMFQQGEFQGDDYKSSNKSSNEFSTSGMKESYQELSNLGMKDSEMMTGRDLSIEGVSAAKTTQEILKNAKEKYPNAETGSINKGQSYEIDLKDGNGMKQYNWNEGPLFEAPQKSQVKGESYTKVLKDLSNEGFSDNETGEMNKFMKGNNLKSNTMERAVESYKSMPESYKRKVSLKEWIAIQMKAGIRKYKVDFPKLNLN